MDLGAIPHSDWVHFITLNRASLAFPMNLLNDAEENCSPPQLHYLEEGDATGGHFGDGFCGEGS